MDQFTPRYFEIEQALRIRISELAPDDALPSDAELCDEFGVSRMTARNAMQRLVQEGLVYRQPGRGTFVARPLVDRQLSNLRGFSAEMRARGLEPSSAVLHTGTRAATPAEAGALALPEKSRVVVIDRVRRADGSPMAYERAVLAPRCAAVLQADLSTTSLHTLLVDLDIVPTSGDSTVTAELADAADAEHLRVRRRSALLVERRLIRDPDAVPIEWTESRYVPDRYTLGVHFTVEAPRPSSPAP